MWMGTELKASLPSVHAQGKKQPNSQTSSLWDRAMEKYLNELKESDDFDTVLEIDNFQDLMEQARSLESENAGKRSSLASINRLNIILTNMNDFSTVLAVSLGANPKVAGLFWGSIRIILTLASASPEGKFLKDIVDMLEDMETSLPRLKSYEENLPMNEKFEASLIEMYTEMICFCARAINFFRRNPPHLLYINSWRDIDADHKRTIANLKRLRQKVDREAEMAQMRLQARNVEILEIMKNFAEEKGNRDEVPCYMVPYGINERFYGREDVLEALGKALDPKEGDVTQKSFALYGMGGVGKTQVALQYANMSKEKFNVIIWISADNMLKMSQSYLEAAQRLGLVKESKDAPDTLAAMLAVKSWLVETKSRWLLVFDNADDLNILKHGLPGSAVGSILLTTRDFNAAFSPAQRGLQVQPFDETVGPAAFLSLVHQDEQSKTNQDFAKEISHALGGLPLALKQISGFIVQHKIALKDFLPLYQRNSAKIHDRKSGLSEYEHSLSTVWEIALSKLPGDASKLQSLLCFFDPDRIHESVLIEGFQESTEADMEFLADEMDFIDAKDALLRAALIDRFPEDSSLSLHRLVQGAVVRRLSADERVIYLDRAIAALQKGFPDTWSSDIGHQFSTWSRCENCLPHVNFIVKQAEKFKIKPSVPKPYAELLLRCSWYLYEREYYDNAMALTKIALETFTDKSSLAYASALDLQGLLELDMNKPKKALDIFTEVLKIRESALGPDDAFIASSLNNIAIAYTEMNDLDLAHSYHNKAIDIRLRTKSDRIGNSYSNMASTLLRMGKFNEAEEMLRRCPALKDFTDETFLNTGNPRFSGDMVLLARIRYLQGRPDDALRLASKALAFRKKLLGNRLKTCDSLYQVASLLDKQGKTSSAIDLLEECVTISESIPEAGGNLARAKFKLGDVYVKVGKQLEGLDCKAAASELKKKLCGERSAADQSEEAYDRLVLWMLW